MEISTKKDKTDVALTSFTLVVATKVRMPDIAVTIIKSTKEALLVVKKKGIPC